MLTTLKAELVTSDERISNSNGTGSGSIGPCISAMISDEVDCEPVPSTDKSQLFFSNPTVPELSSGICQTNSDALYHLKHASEIGLLSYTQGDHVLLVGSCCPPGRQGCPLGVNLSTGATGIFNLCTGRRVPQYHTWVLHGQVIIV
ncbi:hypothetical protein FGIG_10948 [Fasciola gigantica]|uniref:Uncharacterized protein n=1 Tax=Fasciola gigantica TaxID=46835 RepID=A0A504Y847_FASGI|nr:hypothetical protein FGIG_10948 [Fasciola gigantica]